MKNRLLSVAMCLAMLVQLLPMTTLATEEDDFLYVGGRDVISGGYWTGDDDGGIVPGTEENYTVCYEPETRTLTLRDAEITKAYVDRTIRETTQTVWNEDWTEFYEIEGYREEIAVSGIYSNVKINLYLEGASVIDIGDLDADVSEAPKDKAFVDVEIVTNGARVQNGITILGDGSCQLKGADINCDSVHIGISYGLYAGEVSVEGGTIKAYGGNLFGVALEDSSEKGSSQMLSFGVRVDSLTVEKGIVQGFGGTTSSSYESLEESTGISSDGNIELYNGLICGKGNESVNGSSYGIYAIFGSIDVLGGKLNGQSEAAKYNSCGIQLGSLGCCLTVNGGDVSASAGQAQKSIGINMPTFECVFTLLDGTVTCMGDSRAMDVYESDLYESFVLPEEYWWRTGESADYNNSAEEEFVLEEGRTCIVISSDDPYMQAGTMGDDDELEWVYNEPSDEITIVGPVSEKEPVIVASYDVNGRMLSLTIVAESGVESSVHQKSEDIKLIWLAEDKSPKCESISIETGVT